MVILILLFPFLCSASEALAVRIAQIPTIFASTLEPSKDNSHGTDVTVAPRLSWPH